MKFLLLFVLIFIMSVNYKAQINLVPNSGFEIDTTCIYLGYGGINVGDMRPWESPSYGTPDPYDTCANAPFNILGYETPHSGKGYVGILMYDLLEEREYLQVELDSSLVFNKNYCVSFYVSLADSVKFGNNNIGMYFSNSHIYSASSNPLSYMPQINDTNVISDKVGWTNITGNYHATGGERYIIIGNFFSNLLTSTVSLSGHYQYSYYFIDDISVVDCTGEGVNEVTHEEKINIYPNPSEGVFNVSIAGVKIKEIRVFNVLGCEILKQVQNDQNTTIDMSNEAKGMYFVSVQTDKEIINKKMVIE